MIISKSITKNFNKTKVNKKQKLFLIGSISSLLAACGGATTTTTTGNLNYSGKISEGNDFVTLGTDGNGSSVNLGAGDDKIIGGNGNDTIRGGAGADDINGGGGHDNIIIVGITKGNNVSLSRISSARTGSIDVSGIVSEEEIKNNTESDLKPGESIDGGEGGATLISIGEVNYEGVALRNITEFKATNTVILPAKSIKDLTDAGFLKTFDGDNTQLSITNDQGPIMLDFSGIEMVGFSHLTLAKDITIKLDAADIETTVLIDGEGSIQAVSGVLDLDGKKISPDIDILDENGQIVTPKIDEAASISRDITIEENTLSVGTFIVTDESSVGEVTYSLSGYDALYFNIDSKTGLIRLKSARDFENKQDAGQNNVYDIKVTATDEHQKSISQDIKVAISDQNETPIYALDSKNISINENTNSIGTVTARDFDYEDQLTYSISGGDSNLFTINAETSEISFKQAPNFEHPLGVNDDNTYSLTITATDRHGLTASRDISVNINDINDAPTFNENANDINISEGIKFVGQFRASDEDTGRGDILEYSISGVDAALFKIDVATGDIDFKATPDYETPADENVDNIYNITIRTTDKSGAIDEHILNVNITNINEAPLFNAATSEISVDENNAETWSFTAADVDEAHGDVIKYSIKGDDAALFDIDINTGVISFKANPNFENIIDANVNNQYELTIIATDKLGKKDEKTVVITVNDVNETPTFATSPNVINFAENQTKVGTYAAVDDDTANQDVLTYALTGDDAQLFNLNSQTGELAFKQNSDFETKLDSNIDNIYKVSITVTDKAGLSDLKNLEIKVINVNDAPDFGNQTTVFNIVENSINIATITATDDDLDTITYSLVGDDAALFNIDENSGVISLKQGLNFEKPEDQNTDNVYNATVRATDVKGLYTDQTVTVTITDTNEKPVFTSPNISLYLNENLDTPTLVSATDEDADTLVYSIKGADAGLFNLDTATGQLTFKAAPDFEKPKDSNKDNQYDVTVVATDPQNEVSETNLSININDLDEPTLQMKDAVPVYKYEQGQEADFVIEAGLHPDQPDSELGDITIEGIPEGVTFNHGVQTGDTLTLSQEDLVGLKIDIPTEFRGNIDLTLSVTSTGAGDNAQTATTNTKILLSVGNKLNGTDEHDHLYSSKVTDHIDGGGGRDFITIPEGDINDYSFKIVGNDLQMTHNVRGEIDVDLIHSVEVIDFFFKANIDVATLNDGNYAMDLNGIEDYASWLTSNYDYNG